MSQRQKTGHIHHSITLSPMSDEVVRRAQAAIIRAGEKISFADTIDHMIIAYFYRASIVSPPSLHMFRKVDAVVKGRHRITQTELEKFEQLIYKVHKRNYPDPPADLLDPPPQHELAY